MPGYLKAFEAHTGKELKAAVDKLKEEVATVRASKEKLKQEAENMQVMLVAKTEKLETVARVAENLLSQAIQEIDQKKCEPDPHFHSQLARLLVAQKEVNLVRYCGDTSGFSHATAEEFQRKCIKVEGNQLILEALQAEKDSFEYCVPFGRRTCSLKAFIPQNKLPWFAFLSILVLILAFYIGKQSAFSQATLCEPTICPSPDPCPTPPPCPISPTDEVFILRNKTDLVSTAGVYTGQINSLGERHGSGQLIYSNGDRYEGEWRSGVKHGFGSLIIANEGSKTGYWQGDEMVYGEVKHRNGRTYTGEWKTGRYEGFGRMIDGKLIFIGEFSDGQKFGQGCEYREGSLYFGSWSHGEKAGKGLQYYDNFMYYGDFLHDQREGTGFAAWRQGLIYDGPFALGEKQEKGIELHTEEHWHSVRRKEWGPPHHRGPHPPHRPN